MPKMPFSVDIRNFSSGRRSVAPRGVGHYRVPAVGGNCTFRPLKHQNLKFSGRAFHHSGREGNVPGPPREFKTDTIGGITSLNRNYENYSQENMSSNKNAQNVTGCTTSLNRN